MENWIGEQIPDNNNAWLEEEPEEEENEAMENDEEDDAEVINPYEEVDPHNRPPPTSDEETEFTPHVVQIADVDDVPIPHVIQFVSNFHVGESSTSRDLLEGNSEVCTPSPMCCDLKSVHMGVKKLSKQMHDRYRTKKKMEKILRQEELRRNGQAIDITALDSAEEPSIHTAPVPRADDPYVIVRDAARGTREDDDVDTDVPRDTQPPKPRGSPRDLQSMPPKTRSQTNPQLTLTQKDVDQLVQDGIAAAIRDEHERVANLCREVANARSWAEVKQMMTDEFCPTEEVQRLKDELRHLKIRYMNIAAYTKRFNELALLSLDAVPNEKKKENSTQGSNNNNNNNHNRRNYRNNNHHNQNNNRRQNNARALTTAQNMGANQTGVASKCNHCGRCHFHQCPPKCENCGRIGHKAKDCRSKNVASGAAVHPEIVCYRCGERGHKIFKCQKKADQRGGNMLGQAYVIRDAEHNQGPNVVTDTRRWWIRAIVAYLD
nr:hypothetical protein [Tanacetum cinerariifolium]